MRLVKAEPTGMRKTTALVRRANGCKMQEVEEPTYPDSPIGDALRSARHGGERYVSLGDAARALGITAAEYSGLEWGRYKFESAEDLARAIELLTRAATPPAEHQGQAKREEGT